MEEMLEAAFSMLSAPRAYKETPECGTVEKSVACHDSKIKVIRPGGLGTKRRKGPRYKRAAMFRKQRTFNKTIRQTLGLKVEKQAAGFSIGLQEVSHWTLWRSRPSSIQKKRLLAALHANTVGAPLTSGMFLLVN
jgi:DNA-binding transcriptional regulator YiaG